jgi:beta-lactamase regulating signal transducer with metallopeptidase domain
MDLSFMQNEIVLALCWTLIHSLWQGLLLATVTGAVMIGTRKSSAGKRYKLLTALFFVFMAVTVITFVKEYGNGSHAASPVALPAVTALGESGFRVIGVTETNEVVNKPIVERFKDYFNTHASLIVMIWFVIFIARFIRLTANLAYVHRLKNYKTFAPSEEWEERIKELVVTLGLKKKIKLLESGVVKVPVVMGVLKPVVLLPLGLLAHLPADEIEAILLHELAHIKRRDYLVNLLQNFAETIFFFNPALMWVSSMIREERENCCDDIAIAVTNSKSRFINALIAFQEYNFAGSSYTVGFAGRKNQLLNRVKRIINEKNKTLNAAEKSLLTFGMGVFILFSFAAAKKITPPAVKDVLSSLEITQKIKIDTREANKTHKVSSVFALTQKQEDAVNAKDMAALTLISYEENDYELQTDTLPSKGKKLPVRSSNRSVFGEERPVEERRSTYSASADSISNLFTNISSNSNNDDLSITATHKNGTEYRYRKNAGVVSDFYINGKQFTDIDVYRSVIVDIEKALEYRRVRSRERMETNNAHREQMMLDKKQKIEERRQTIAERHQLDRVKRDKNEKVEEGRRLDQVARDKNERVEERRQTIAQRGQLDRVKRDKNDKVEERSQLDKVVPDKNERGEERRQTESEKHQRDLKEQHERNETKEKWFQLKPDSLHQSKWIDLKSKNGDSVREYKKVRLAEKKFNADAKFGMRQKFKARTKLDVASKFDLKTKMDVNAKSVYKTPGYDIDVRENNKKSLSLLSDSSRRIASDKARESAAQKREWMRIRQAEDDARIQAEAKKLKEIIADLEKEGIKVDLGKSWLALDKGQFVVDGKAMPKEMHEKFIAKYVTSADGWGYYYGPIQVRGRGIFMDYKDLVR